MIKAFIHFLISAAVLWLVGQVLPGVTVASLSAALWAAVAIAAIGWLVERVMGTGVSRYNRGMTGFLTAAVVIYLASIVSPGFDVGIIGALLASFVIGLIDMVLPTTIR